MAFFSPRHPLLKALFALGSGLFYVFMWRRDKKRQPGKVVDATAKVIDDKKYE